LLGFITRLTTRITRRKKKLDYVPPNPHPRAFTPEGDPVRWEFWQVMMDMRDRIVRLEEKEKLRDFIFLGILGVILARLMGAI